LTPTGGKSHRPVEFEGATLVVENLNKRYRDGTWANRDISLDAKPGEILGILGPNGAGKTTLVRQITTELLPTSGKITVLGHDVASQSDIVKSLLGVMPQEVTLFDYLTVFHHLRIFGKFRGLSGPYAARRAEELVADLGLSQYRNVPIMKTTGGLRRRLLVGIAALAKPPLMVLDEPTTGLDLEARRILWNLLKGYKEIGTTVLLTTHYMEEAEALCDRIGIIQRGRLLALDTLDNLRVDHSCEYKITYAPNGTGNEVLTLYGANDRDLIAQVRSLGAHHISVAKTNLEDIYLALTGIAKGPNGRSD